AFLLYLPIRLGLIQAGFVSSIIEMMVGLNIGLAAFNLLPIPPLDGSHLVEYFLSPEMTESYYRFGPYILLFVVASSFSGFSLLDFAMKPLTAFFSLLIRGVYISIY
ncbi:MAG: site-2 protease family protein, partial [Candidatus Berkelbacteria bacterium]|nr:site-2 protease family protein [Candidatus Berkelbacteria bacterium]